jgi:hypothetical protein
MLYQIDWKVSPPDPELANTDSCDDVGIPWTVGVHYPGEVPQPINCKLHPRRGRKMRDIFLTDIPLFSVRLLTAMQSVGVDNLEIYDARLIGPEGQVFENYKAVNIVGAIACADLEKSVYLSNNALPFKKFSRLVVKGSNARGLDLFRLAEDPLMILVSERVNRAIVAIDPVGMVLNPIEVID